MDDQEFMDRIDANLSFSFSRSSGAGGQNVNKVSTRVTARLPLESLTWLSDRQVELLRSRLGGRINSEGELTVHVQEERSQARNREIAVERVHTLLLAALEERRRRRPTKPSKAARRARLDAKRRRSLTKVNRRRVDRDG